MTLSNDFRGIVELSVLPHLQKEQTVQKIKRRDWLKFCNCLFVYPLLSGRKSELLWISRLFFCRFIFCGIKGVEGRLSRKSRRDKIEFFRVLPKFRNKMPFSSIFYVTGVLQHKPLQNWQKSSPKHRKLAEINAEIPLTWKIGAVEIFALNSPPTIVTKYLIGFCGISSLYLRILLPFYFWFEERKGHHFRKSKWATEGTNNLFIELGIEIQKKGALCSIHSDEKNVIFHHYDVFVALKFRLFGRENVISHFATFLSP